MAYLDRFPKVQKWLGDNFFGEIGPKATSGDGWVSRGADERIMASHNSYQTVFTVSYDGEKTQGAMGPIKRYWLNYVALRARSWQSYLDSEITQGIIKKYVGWIIGSGLQLQSEPVKLVLESEGIDLSDDAKDRFVKMVEARFKLFSKSKNADHAKRKSLHQIAHTAKMNAVIGGDVLVILRLIEREITVELVDGTQITQPIMSSNAFAEAKKRGNRIRHGVEIDENGEHFGYWVRKAFNKFTLIEARPAGRLTAFLVYGLEYRIDGARGIPLISAVMESIKKVDRYREATVGSAEERQKITYWIGHGVNSTGENPLQHRLKASFDVDADQQTGKIDGEAFATKVATSTDKQVINMPNDATLNALDPKNELYYKDFYNTNINAIAAAIGIPPEVAFSKYDSNFSASRAALKDWEHTIKVERNNFAFQFYQNIFNFWLEVQVLTFKIQAPGYLEAIARSNDMVMDSYTNSRFVGSNVPHIDPVKEVKAERLKLGKDHLPLTTASKATEALDGGEYDVNVEKVKDEVEAAEGLENQMPTSEEPAESAEPTDDE